MESVQTVTARRDRILSAVTAVIGKELFDGSSASAAAEAAVVELPAGCKYSAVYRCFAGLVGGVPDRTGLREMCWAMAADVAALREDRTVAAGRIPAEEADIVAQFMAARRRPDRGRGAKGFPVAYRVMGLVGPGCPLRFEVIWSSRYVAYFASSPGGLGFKRPAAEAGRPYRHFTTLVGMRAVLTVVPGDRGVEVKGSRCTDSQRDHNRALTAMRWREDFECPFGYDHHCQECPKGQSSCPAACRPVDLVDRLCAACGNVAAHDPGWDVGMCIHCDSLGKRPNT